MADVIVIGGGTAGCSFASHLLNTTDARVVVVEAGDEFDSHPLNLFTSMSRPAVIDVSLRASAVEMSEQYGYLQASVLGGGSAVNGLVALPGAMDDFNEWCENDGLSEWSWDDVAPWFDRVATQTTLVDDTAVGSVSRLVSSTWSTSRPVPLAFAGQSRHSADINALHRARATGRLSLRTGTQVSRILFTGARATAVELVDGGVLEASRIVVCAGALRTPMLLRHSGLDISGLGENLQDHPNIMLTARRRTPFTGDVPISRYVPLKDSRDVDGPDVAHVLAYEQIDADGALAAVGVSLMDVHSRGALVETSSGQWSAAFRCLSDDRDRRLFMDTVRDVTRALVGSDLRETFDPADAERLVSDLARVAQSSDAELSSWLDRNVRTLSHAVGTCAMGTVCDGKGRVSDIDGLWVADASLMPRIVRANTNETVAMMATRVAQFVAESLEG